MSYALPSALLALVLCSCLVKIVKGPKAVGYLPGPLTISSPMTIPGVLLSNIFPIATWNLGINWCWTWRNFLYQKYKSETISVTPILTGSPTIYTSSFEVARQVLSGSSEYYKAPDSTVALLLWGENVISAEHEVYKRHRRIVGPAFASSSLFSLVWEETLKTYQEMMVAEGWSGQESVTSSTFNHYASTLALVIVTRCGFGLPTPWPKMASTTAEPSLYDSMALVSQNVILRLATPRWCYKLPIKKLKDVEKAYQTMGKYMTRFVAQRRASLQAFDDDPEEEQKFKADLLSRLVMANEKEGKLVLDDKELIGNTFAFLFAGYETTAHVISATLALLAIHPEEQEKVAEEIRSVLPDGRDPVFSDAPSLKKVLACFREAIRMFPAGNPVTRDTTQPVTITITTDNGERRVAVPAGTRIIMDMIGLHYNPRYFEDPEAFKPSRWYDAQDSDLTFFSMGPRACIGRRFATTEAQCFLTAVLRDWVISPLLLHEHETHAQWRERVMQGSLVGLAFGIKSVPLRMTRRPRD